ncbi:uracil-DNA glycosylase family protein [Siculibacillus lacustris]|uniref:Uracil-DNA glycosylase family protein n=1 Tax=Siculibacillus lacustris TaxID=1549641 RepID=A0A4Q9VX24_9HYPH|nr:uracil-DNA glycosylase family protein [Siculibacillus lacustris]TBW40933.1 uracil-DNA glycosylase family protein [Siculibacillus lacustris]
MTADAPDLAGLCAEIAACRLCRDAPTGRPLPHEPRPVLVASATARILVAGQAPGVRVHASGRPFTDPSGDRLRAWMGIDAATFYDAAQIAVVPMGFCFPGHDAAGGDLPPRRECAPQWRARVMAAMPAVDFVLALGRPAQLWHLGADAGPSVAAAVADWRRLLDRPGLPQVLPLPHPSWRNSGWLKRHPWFDAEVVPVLRRLVAERLAHAPDPS